MVRELRTVVSPSVASAINVAPSFLNPLFFGAKSLPEAFHAANKSPQHFAFPTQDHEVRVGSHRENALIRDSRYPRRISASGCYCLGQIPFCETRQIPYRTVHGQNASGQLAIRHAFAISNIHFEGSKPIAAIRHSGCGHSIRDEHSLLRAFGLSKKLHDGRIKMNAIGDNVRAHPTIRQHRTQNTGIAMIRRAMVQRSHGIEGMRRVARSRRDSASGRLKIGVGMSQAHAHAAPRRFGNDLGRVLQFRSNRHHKNPAARRLPELLERAQFRSQ